MSSLKLSRFEVKRTSEKEAHCKSWKREIRNPR